MSTVAVPLVITLVIILGATGLALTGVIGVGVQLVATILALILQIVLMIFMGGR